VASKVESNAASPAQHDAWRLTAPSAQRPVVQPLSPERYQVQFTVGQDAYDILQRLQTLLRRELPDGDAGAIFERGLRLLYKEVEASRFGRPKSGYTTPKGKDNTPKGAPKGPGQASESDTYETRIRPGAGGSRSRHIPREVKRAVWYRDRAQCAFVSATGRRCSEREFLELHHIQPYALGGPSTAENIALRCRRHNAYEAERDFGPWDASAAS
jgi:hypothetical protein